MEISAKVHLGVQEFQSDSTRATSQRSYTMLGVPTMSWILEADSQMLRDFFMRKTPFQKIKYLQLPSIKCQPHQNLKVFREKEKRN